MKQIAANVNVLSAVKGHDALIVECNEVVA